MVTITATATEMQNNFGRYLALVMAGQEVVVTRSGCEVGRFIPKEATVSYLTDSLTGILKGDCDAEQVKEERLREKLNQGDGLINDHPDSDCCIRPLTTRTS